MINSKKIIYILLIYLISNHSSVFAQQERLVPLISNPVIKKYLAENPNSVVKIASVADTLNLPFIDDFSDTKVYPNPARWMDNLVFINSNFPRSPLSIGVATFDGLDAYGNAYDQVNASAQGPADTLTSKPFYLLTKPASLGGGLFTLNDSITLSFYYEKKGWGDAPEVNDSLVVEYYNPSDSSWTQQWYSLGGINNNEDTSFQAVQVRLTDVNYLKDGFQFRFRSYGSRAGSLDNWHIDYVRLYNAYNLTSGQMDTIYNDVAFTQPGVSILKEFTSVPWSDFISLSASAQQAMIKDSSSIYYRINDVTHEDVGFNDRIYDFSGSYVAGNGQTNGNIYPSLPNNVNLTYKFPVDSVFPNSPSQLPDSTFFTITDFFSNGNSFSGLKSNDTISYKQEFYNYYSYDDGSAEAGYNLYNAPNGKLAMRFDLLKADTIRAIRFMFLQQGANVSTKLFTIKIWSSLTPETLIYQEPNNRPVYIDSINGYATYVLNQIVPVSGTIYIGFQQVSPDDLHLGFDRNTASNSKMFYNVTGTWSQILVAAGTLMIRPVMGDSTLFVGLKPTQADNWNILLYPNPTGSQLHINADHADQIKSMSVLDLEGRVISATSFSSDINVGKLTPGIYIIKFYKKDDSIITKKFTVTSMLR